MGLFLDSYLHRNAARSAFYLDGHILCPPFVFVYFFGGAELGTPGSRIDSNFSGIGGNWFAG
jgi:hypothetical protein